MSSTRPDILCLQDILAACGKIESFLAGVDRASFLTNEYIQSAVAYQFIVIGEAVGLLSQELRNRHPNVAWRMARGLRNVAAHTYFSMDWRVIWDTTQDDLPTLRMQIAEILASEFPGAIST